MTHARPSGQIAESVCPGHPDKVADQISDAVVDAYLAQDPNTRVNCEVLVTRERVVVTGQITARADVDIEQVVRGVLRDVGYRDPRVHGMSADSSAVEVLVDRQAREIATGVDAGGAGDSGIVYGFACDETPEFMPLCCTVAHDVAREIAAFSPAGGPSLGPDGKVQVALSLREDHIGAGVVVSAQHSADLGLEDVRRLITEEIVAPVLRRRNVATDVVYVNPAGTFVIGGPSADAGLTGRKLMVDTYGGVARHGGGCFSGKDATKVDRSGAYLARYLAVNVVAAGLARRCQVGIGYAIGRSDPVWFDVDFFETAAVDQRKLVAALRDPVDMRVETVIARLGLRTMRYRPTATFGHFGRPDLALPWERLDIAPDLRAALGE